MYERAHDEKQSHLGVPVLFYFKFQKNDELRIFLTEHAKSMQSSCTDDEFARILRRRFKCIDGDSFSSHFLGLYYILICSGT